MSSTSSPRSRTPFWTLHGDGRRIEPGAVVLPGERLSWPRTAGIGAQHVVAMFGATFLVPILTGFPVPTTLLFSGVGTILFLLITRNKLPSYLGSSFAFIAPVTAATASAKLWPQGAPGHAAPLNFLNFAASDERHARRAAGLRGGGARR